MTGTDSKVEKSRIRNRNHPNPKTYSKTYSGADSRPESLTALSDMHLINQHFTLEYFGIGLSLKFLYAKTHLRRVLGRPRPQAPHAAAALKMRDGDAVHTRVPGTEEGRVM